MTSYRLDVLMEATCLYSVFQATDAEVGLSESNFLGLVQTLLKDPDEREHFFQVSQYVGYVIALGHFLKTAVYFNNLNNLF